MKKRGSLNLSINAIVVLIMAITMLGLGLGFITGMFGDISKQVGSAVKNEPEPPMATRSNPLTVSRDYVVADLNEDIGLKFSTFNSVSNVGGNANSGITGSCTSSKIGTVVAVDPDVAAGKTKTISTLIPITGAGKFICTFKDTSLNTGEAFVTFEVTS